MKLVRSRRASRAQAPSPSDRVKKLLDAALGEIVAIERRATAHPEPELPFAAE